MSQNFIIYKLLILLVLLYGSYAVAQNEIKYISCGSSFQIGYIDRSVVDSEVETYDIVIVENKNSDTINICSNILYVDSNAVKQIWGQESLFYFSNNNWDNCGANEDGRIVPSIYEITLPCKPLKVIHTCYEQVVILSKENVIYISQESWMRQSFDIIDLLLSIGDLCSTDMNISELLYDLKDNKIVQIIKKEDFTIALICSNIQDYFILIKSIASFNVIRKGAVKPW